MKKAKIDESVVNEDVAKVANFVRKFTIAAALVLGSLIVVSFVKPERCAKVDSLMHDFVNSNFNTIMIVVIVITVAFARFVAYVVNEENIKSFLKRRER